METQTSPQAQCFDAFVSHASQDAKFAARLVRSMEGGGLKIWFDDSELKFGALLRNQLQSAIGASGVLVLIWSEAANRSRWVMAEMFTAFHLGRFIIPCVLDETPLPQFLQNAAYLNPQRDKTQIAEKLLRTIKGVPAAANEVIVLPSTQSQLIRSFAKSIGAAQLLVLAGLNENFEQAASANASLDSALQGVKDLAPLDREVLALAGYQCKNNYIIKHWASIRQWSFPKDELLDRGERYFFETLCINPKDANAVNGLGSILFYELELDAAEFFQKRAIELIRSTGGKYEAAEHDLEMILTLRRMQSGT
jgi:hypothetical protein